MGNTDGKVELVGGKKQHDTGRQECGDKTFSGFY